ncbi:hypothetical protein EAF64_15430 [Halorientalis pallida]|uniref:Uncharacterized protein n=1 Tax=Halorientalis pallida TaxID=2479928 RepID=A0A498KTI1_9EURY|nr:hypothetical protein EAF64_15430 [Halorientalis pallida]
MIKKYGSCPFARTGWLAIYKTELVRAVESLLSPLGWDRSKIRREHSSGTRRDRNAGVNGVCDH